jgi:hypothetical protein
MGATNEEAATARPAALRRLCVKEEMLTEIETIMRCIEHEGEGYAWPPLGIWMGQDLGCTGRVGPNKTHAGLNHD